MAGEGSDEVVAGQVGRGLRHPVEATLHAIEGPGTLVGGERQRATQGLRRGLDDELLVGRERHDVVLDDETPCGRESFAVAVEQVLGRRAVGLDGGDRRVGRVVAHRGGDLGHGGARVGHRGAADRGDLLRRLPEQVLVGEQVDQQLTATRDLGCGVVEVATAQLGGKTRDGSGGRGRGVVEGAGPAELGGGARRRLADELSDAGRVVEGRRHVG